MIRKARKEHACTYCNNTIKPGDTYDYQEGKEPLYDDDVMGNDVQIGIRYYKDKMCLKCDEELCNTA